MKVQDKWLRILLPLIPSLLLFYLSYSAGKGSLIARLSGVVAFIAICEVARLLIYKSRHWFTGKYQKLKRTTALFLSGIGATAFLLIVINALRNYLSFGDFRMGSSYGVNVYFNKTHLTNGTVGSSVFYAVFIFLFLFFVYEVIYHFGRMRFIERQRDRLEKEKLQAELQQLKGIVNPHFLFNNLNSLSALIGEDPVRAEAFLDELTKVFRYLLRNNNTELTSVGEELQFIHSYYHLLQTRYGKSISLQLSVSNAAMSSLLPPLTLQLLVENAVKHNRLQKNIPLEIEIFNEGDNKLVVRNTLCKRDKPVESTGIGLHSINSRYILLQHPGPDIVQDDHSFSVIITLINSATEERGFQEKRATLAQIF